MPRRGRSGWLAIVLLGLMSPCYLPPLLRGAVDQTGETGNFAGCGAGVEYALTTNLGDDFLGDL